jgi:transposase InsO family protein
MRRTASEKLEIIRLVEGSELPVKRVLRELDVPRSTFYEWYRRYEARGFDGLKDRSSCPRRFWNRIPDSERRRIVEVALEHPEKSPRELAWYITDTRGAYVSESSVYRILKAEDLITSPAFCVLSAKDKFDQPTQAVHELWQTDFTYLRIVGWGWYYLTTILDDYSRFVIAWTLCQGQTAGDVTELLEKARRATGLDHVTVRHQPRLLSDNGPAYISKHLAEYLEGREMEHTRGRPYHPMTQGKIERYHRSLKNVVTLQNYYLPCDLEQEIRRFVDHYNMERFHESLDNLTPADVYHGRSRDILTARWKVKRQTLRRRRCLNQGRSAGKEELILPAKYRETVP